MLTTNQLNWIFQKVSEFTNKYQAKWPFKDQDWIDIQREAIELHRKSRNNELVADMLLNIINYFEMEARKNEQ